jgi:uncharacterized protein HemX
MRDAVIGEFDQATLREILLALRQGIGVAKFLAVLLLGGVSASVWIIWDAAQIQQTVTVNTAKLNQIEPAMILDDHRHIEEIENNGTRKGQQQLLGIQNETAAHGRRLDGLDRHNETQDDQIRKLEDRVRDLEHERYPPSPNAPHGEIAAPPGNAPG